MRKALLLVVFGCVFLALPACRDGSGGKGKAAASSSTPIESTPIDMTDLQSVAIHTPLAKWFLQENAIALSKRGSIDLSAEEETFWHTKVNEDFFLAYLFLLRDFSRKNNVSTNDSSSMMLDAYEAARGLPAENMLSKLYVRDMVNDLDIAEIYWQGQYALQVSPGDIYPQPWEFSQAVSNAPSFWSGMAMSSLLEVVVAGRAMVPEAHRQAIGVVSLARIPPSYAGYYYHETYHPRPPHNRTIGAVFLSRELLMHDAKSLETPLYAFVHEVGHVVDDLVLVDSTGIDPSMVFYSISWSPNLQKRRTTHEDFVSEYSETNALEDFAEHYTYFRFPFLADAQFRSKIVHEWDRTKAVDPAARQATPLFQKYWLMWLMFGHEEFGALHPEITALLETMPKAWPQMVAGELAPMSSAASTACSCAGLSITAIPRK